MEAVHKSCCGYAGDISGAAMVWTYEGRPATSSAGGEHVTQPIPPSTLALTRTNGEPLEPAFNLS
jgi:hypothetical protein